MKKVVVGLSGGVDSSVCCALLKEQGYEVIAVFMRNWDSTVNNEQIGITLEEDDICPQELDYLDAKRTCEILDIPLHKVNFVDEYWNEVFSYFLNELKLGRTPNPDMMCNKFIKFDRFIEVCEELGADYIAFGHYAQIEHNPMRMYRGHDNNKDQTYFLGLVEKEKLEKVIFPIGHLDKSEVRDLAIKYNLNTATKKDSTGICFIGERNFPQFLQNYFTPKKGDIKLIENGQVLGQHMGLVNYTVGQRKGINIGGKLGSLYVVGKDVDANILYVSNDVDSPYLVSNSCIIDNLNLYEQIDENKQYTAKFRYRQKDNEVTLKLIDDKLQVSYPQGVSSVTPGQACIIYDNDLCLGGGIIQEVYHDNKQLVYFKGDIIHE